MRKSKSEEIIKTLKRVKAQLGFAPKPPVPVTSRTARAEYAPDAPLDPELQRILSSVGDANYARATAYMFAPGGRFNRVRKPRYAKT